MVPIPTFFGNLISLNTIPSVRHRARPPSSKCCDDRSVSLRQGWRQNTAARRAAVAALYQGAPGQMTWLMEDLPPWLRPA